MKEVIYIMLLIIYSVCGKRLGGIKHYGKKYFINLNLSKPVKKKKNYQCFTNLKNITKEKVKILFD